MWFYYAQRYRENDQADVNVFYSTNPLATTYNPSTTPAHYGGFDGDNQIRLTTQLTKRNKVSFLFDKINKCNCPTIVDVVAFTAESQSRLMYPGSLGTYDAALTWQAIITPKLLWDSRRALRSRKDRIYTSRLRCWRNVADFHHRDRGVRAPYFAGAGLPVFSRAATMNAISECVGGSPM